MESLPPEERRVLSWRHRRLVIVTAVVRLTACALALAAVCVLVWQWDSARHLVGASEKQWGVVTEVHDVLWCSRVNPRSYTVRWHDRDGLRTGTLKTCVHHDRDAQVAFWVAGEKLHDEPPTTTARVGIGVGTAGGVAAVLAALRSLRRRRRTYAAVLDGTWAPVALHTVGLPGGPAFRISETGQHLPPRRVRPLYVGPRTARFDAQVPGTLWADRVHLQRPRGLCLHTAADGSRTWLRPPRLSR